MCELILCPNFDIDEYHKLLCIKGDCNNCGISKFQLCPFEMDPNNEIWTLEVVWEYMCLLAILMMEVINMQ
jgi:hypothetical protein